ncbi:sodium:proton antiporter [Alkalihalobacillus alcalophilus ATCC 27647 = CGMCC 1.3604]|uniref:Sodium ion:proton antiporter transporter n=1 Tax=Alkalihalobacillus alcalophilus ATCC 27647 = CGMCC 1.3604 TaxID=1218173 RepID=J8TA80_ALKAL|nr:Na+/H+ antiporter NhaC family protein [Alkalihalobacillus alcalophilus]AFV25808.1 sodium ion:proton antiporter transporter [Alkalihalobacillus alcalophilus ATCC 27647 = CGMCC 1.3604]KGA95751.1 sodium:proton antiporter [Alkalihalobacillus alcalophilus ATCC 27647 = CGMCC 1.3604]MED1563642.1 Na+/H+ antiporter NhaC family protein [Alkalihalobacillus alcalophilus]THG90560.1 sodium:proton antiporter [Alkalihalobacillus alcalophilus ATCC 27647 = CGMCC 1.3604]
MNAVLIAVVVMLVLSLLRVHVVLALLIGSIVGGVTAGLSLQETMQVFSEGLGGGASIALSYAILGAFAVAISQTSLPDAMVKFVIKLVGKNSDSTRKNLSKALIFFFLLMIACFSQNIIPIHIAFIPILIPPIIKILNQLEIDRRAIASILTFGLIAPYMLLPYGFGYVFQGIVVENIVQNGLDVTMSQVTPAMVIPVAGMFLGLLVAVFISYRKSRTYEQKEIITETESNEEEKSVEAYIWSIIASLIAIFVTLVVQTISESMVLAGLAGIIVLYLTRALKWSGSDKVLTDGMKMMAFISFVMISAAGFSEVIRATGHVELLVEQVLNIVGESQATTALLMLIVGLVLTLGIGSAFSTVPILATIFVPLGMAVGFSPMAIITLIGTAGALGDAGAPASDSTLGPTAGLNADGQHNHIWDTCVPTFLHYNIPLIIFGWIAAMMF